VVVNPSSCCSWASPRLEIVADGHKNHAPILTELDDIVLAAAVVGVLGTVAKGCGTGHGALDTYYHVLPTMQDNAVRASKRS
jgi:hypothetical protein